jgi:hypothetical protein
MKKLLLFLFISAALPGMSQSWAAPGATWYYDFMTPTPPLYYGYERIQNIGDTIINSKQYNKLQIFRVWYDTSTQITNTYYVPQLEFTRADSGVVYYYRDSADYVLYDFNAQPGDTWVLRGEFEGLWCDTSSVVVDSISVRIINGDTLRALRTSPVNWTGITFHYPPLVEKLGSMANLFPYTMCMSDIPQGYNLRCYSDSTGWMWQNPNWLYPCDDIMSVQDPVQNESFAIVYDLQSHAIKLNGALIKDGALIHVYDSYGRLVAEEFASTSGSAELHLNAAAGGIYFVSVCSEGIQASQPFFMSNN